MAFSSGISTLRTGTIALTLVSFTGTAGAQNYQSLGNYDQWERQLGARITPQAPAIAPLPVPVRPRVYFPPASTPAPAYRPPTVQYVEPPRYRPPKQKPRREYFGDGRDDTILYGPTGRIIGTRSPDGRTRYTPPPVPEPGNDDYDFQRDGRGRDGWAERYGSDDDGRADRRDVIREPGNDDYGLQHDGRGREGNGSVIPEPGN